MAEAKSMNGAFSESITLTSSMTVTGTCTFDLVFTILLTSGFDTFSTCLIGLIYYSYLTLDYFLINTDSDFLIGIVL